MINSLDFFDLRLQILQLSNNISDDLLKSIIYDEQFQKLNYDYDILYIIDKVLAPYQSVNAEKTIEEVKAWVHNFILQLNNLSKHNYSNDELIIFETFFIYKITLENKFFDLQIRTDLSESYIQDILSTLSISVENNTSAWLAKEKIRITFLNHKFHRIILMILWNS